MINLFEKLLNENIEKVEPITMFKDKYEFLSNFYIGSEIIFLGHKYMTAEHIYQALKTNNFKQRLEIISAETPGKAKRLGKICDIRKDWNKIKDDIMLQTVRAKFFQSLALSQELLKTGKAELIEGNWWGDKYWGVCDGEGKNKLGKILMQVRDELNKGFDWFEK